MKTPLLTLLTFAFLFANCTNTTLSEIEEITKDSPNITGKAEYLDSPLSPPGTECTWLGIKMEHSHHLAGILMEKWAGSGITPSN